MADFTREYIICHAPCYPDPYRPWPQTLENAQKVQREVGGEIKTRLVSEWQTPEPVLSDAGPSTATPSGGAEGAADNPNPVAGPCMSTEEKRDG